MIVFKEKHIRSAIFDMDGTLFDTERLRFKTLKQASLELSGKPLTDDVLIGSLGLSARKAEELAKSVHGDTYPYAEIRRRADELELAHVRSHGVPVKPGLVQVLERLRKSGLTMAVATSSRRAIAEEYLINANVLKFFDVTVCGDEVEQGKPHPEIFLRAASALNSAPDECLMFEDSENGLMSAVQSGGQAILLLDIKPPRPEIRSRAFQDYASMMDFLSDLMACTPQMNEPALTEAFPQTRSQLKAGIHGFGAIGGGYLTQIFSHWDGYTRPGEIIAATGNKSLHEAVNAFGKYSVRYSAAAFDQTIEHVRLIDTADAEAVMEMYAACEIVGLSLPEQAIVQQAGLIARGLLRRFERSGRELTLLVVLNKVEGGAYVRRHVSQALAALVPDESLARQVMDKVFFAETVVSRIVSKLSKESLQRQIRIKSAMFQSRLARVQKSLSSTPRAPAAAGPKPSDLDRMVTQLRLAAEPANALASLHLILFNSEPDMMLYAERGSPLLERLRQVRTVDDIAQIQTIKNRLWNGTHAMLAWYASLLGHDTIGRGMGDARVSAFVSRVIRDEIEPALLREHPEMKDVVRSFVNTFMERCKSSFKDPCDRVGRDPLRKLQRRERILGSIELARKHGIETPALEFGAALAVLYAIRAAGPGDKESQRIRELYAVSSSIDDVLTYSGNYGGKPYLGLDPARDRQLIAGISSHFERLAATVDGEYWNWPLSPRAARASAGRERQREAA